MAFPAFGDYNGGVCPQSHPVAIYSVFYEFYYDTSPFTDYQNLVYAMGDPTGYGLHGDFLNGWSDQNALAQAVNTCQGPQGAYATTCSVNSEDGSAVALNPVVPAPAENVGLTGPIAALPGNNPITGTFIKARSSKFRTWSGTRAHEHSTEFLFGTVNTSKTFQQDIVPNLRESIVFICDRKLWHVRRLVLGTCGFELEEIGRGHTLTEQVVA
jgi:hypothetical protein